MGLSAQIVNQPTERPATAQTQPAAPAPAGVSARLAISIPLIDRPLSLADFEGMQAGPEWRDKLAHVTTFIQNQPIDGAPATEKTEAWLARTRTTLYIVFICFDRHPELIRSHLARRENITKDDVVTVMLDPFQDRQRGVGFQVNPAGVQADASYTETNGADYSYDLVWDSDGRITDKGWMALIAIPFRSLRFPAMGPNWGMVLGRNLPRNSETDWWPRIAANVSGMLSQEGTLHGIEGVSGSHNVQIDPYVLGQNEHSLDVRDPNDPYFSTRNAEMTAGGEAKAIWRDAMVFDGTVNPDFSDVESDQPQFTVDQRYPVYFPELRPFFLENASYFGTPLTLVYTRNIVRPDWGARVTGKAGHTNLGLFAVDDREPGQTVPANDRLYGAKAFFGVGRVSEDLGEGSNAGLMYTDEEFGGGWNRIGAADLTWRANNHWTLLGQMAESSTMGSDPASASTVLPSGYRAGPAADVQLQRSGHAFSMFNEYQDVGTGFDTLPGFFQTADIRSNHLHSTYQWFPKKSVIQSYGLETNQNVAFDHQHRRVYHYSTFDPFWLLPRNIVLAPLAGENSDTVGPQNGYAMPASENFTENFAGVVARGQPWATLNFNLEAFRGGNVNYNPPAGALPFLLNQQTIQAMVTVNPFRQLTSDNTYLLDRDHAVKGGALVYETQTFRTKLNYQFTRAWSARAIVEYDTTLANPAETSLSRTREVQTQALLTWLPHPGTVVYMGWNDDLENYAHTVCTPLLDGIPHACNPDQPILARGPGLLNDGRQFFVKASYLIRF